MAIASLLKCYAHPILISRQVCRRIGNFVFLDRGSSIEHLISILQRTGNEMRKEKSEMSSIDLSYRGNGTHPLGGGTLPEGGGEGVGETMAGELTGLPEGATLLPS